MLVATTRTQGRRGHDTISCSPGELVDVTSSCDSRSERCGCCRLFTGLTSRLTTSTAEVVERELTLDAYVAAHHASLLRAGLSDEPRIRALAETYARQMARVAEDFPLGTVVERSGTWIRKRPRRIRRERS